VTWVFTDESDSCWNYGLLVVLRITATCLQKQLSSACISCRGFRGICYNLL